MRPRLSLWNISSGFVIGEEIVYSHLHDWGDIRVDSRVVIHVGSGRREFLERGD
jgi:hypothetical protein